MLIFTRLSCPVCLVLISWWPSKYSFERFLSFLEKNIATVFDLDTLNPQRFVPVSTSLISGWHYVNSPLLFTYHRTPTTLQGNNSSSRFTEFSALVWQIRVKQTPGYLHGRHATLQTLLRQRSANWAKGKFLIAESGRNDCIITNATCHFNTTGIYKMT